MSHGEEMGTVSFTCFSHPFSTPPGGAIEHSVKTLTGTSGSQSVFPGPAASASLQGGLEMQTIRPLMGGLSGVGALESVI